MDSAYNATDGVREITAAAEQLQTARDTLDTMGALNALTRRGIDVGDLVFLHGSLARRRPRPDARTPAADTASSTDWFS